MYICMYVTGYLLQCSISTLQMHCLRWWYNAVLGHLLFLLYTADVRELATRLGLSSHFYADDTQLYTSGPPSRVAQQRQRMEPGIQQIAEWMRSNRLQLNPEKTDFLWCATSRRCLHLDTGALNICGVSITPSTSVRDLGVLLGSDCP